MVSRKRSGARKYAYRGDPMVEPPPPELAAILERHRGARDGLITALEEIQRHYGYLGQDQLRYAARELSFPLAQVYGVATFYNLFLFDPPGEVVVRVCRGTACHVNQADAILQHLCDKLEIGVDETTPDQKAALEARPPSTSRTGGDSTWPQVAGEPEPGSTTAPSGRTQSPPSA